MKTVKNIVIMVASMIIAFMLLSNVAKATTVKVTAEVLNIREEATTDSDVVAMISEDSECEVLGEEGDWYEIQYKSYHGYISKQYATLVEEPEEEKTETESSKTQTQNNTETQQKENTQKQETKTVQYQKIVKDSSVKILPLIYAKNIGNLKKDTEVVLIAKTGSWAYIQTNEFSGWVRQEVLTEGKTVTTGEDSTSINEKIGYVNESYVNVREGAGTSYSIVKVVTLNSELTIIGEENGWYQVKSGSDIGYISKEFVSDTKKTTSRSLDTARTSNNETKNSEEEKASKVIIGAEDTSKQTETKNETDSNSKKVETAKETETTKTEASKTNAEKKTEEKSETKVQTSSNKGEEMVAYAKQFLGARYVYGGDGSNGTFDCSGFTMYVYRHFGVSLPHGATSQSKVSNGTKITKQSNLKTGDIVFLSDYETGVGIGHCGIYISDGNFIHASTSGYQVIISSLNTTYAGRFVSGMRFLK